MSLKDKAINSVKWNTLATVYGMLIQILRLSILTYLLDKADFGLVAIATMVISFTDVFSDLGITVAIIHTQQITKEQYSSIFWLNVITSFLIFFSVCVCAPLVSMFYNETILLYIIPLLGTQILMNAFGKMFQTIKTKQLEFAFISKVRILAITIGFIITVLLALLGCGVYSLVIGQLVHVFVNQLIYAISGLRHEKILFHFKISEIKDMLKIGGYQLGAKLLDFVSSKIDVFLIGKFFDMDDLGLYNLAKELIYKPYQIICSLVSNVASATFAKLQYDIVILRNNYAKLVKMIAFISIPIYFATFIFADVITGVLYSKDFEGVSIFLRILSIFGMFTSIDGIGGTLQVALGRTDIGLKWTLIRVVISIFSIWISSFFTIYAVAYSQAIVAVLCYFLYWKFAIYRLIKINLFNYLNIIKTSLLVSIVISIPFIVIQKYINMSFEIQIASLLLFICAYLVYYLIFEKQFASNIIAFIKNK